jgi:UDP-4-amino-4,6-dideoxy-N-acetyl-beta-L-altrosamine transaminase
MKIPYAKQQIDKSDIDGVVRALKSAYLTQGPIVQKFEEAVVKYSGARYGIATNSATSALHVSCLALEIKKGDLVWTSPNTFVSSANCALFCNARVDFIDIELDTYCISIKELEKKLKKALRNGDLPKVVIPVHFAGHSCNMKKIHELSKIYGFKIIEDASHAIGGEYENKKIGSCKYSDITVFSFHPVKIITSGEGGMIMTNNTKIMEKVVGYRSHGITREKDLFEPRKINEIWNYQQLEIGFNYRLTDIQAALGISQLQKIDKFIQKRRELVNQYNIAFKLLPLIIPKERQNTKSSYHLYIIRISENSLYSQKEFYEYMHRNNILVNVHYIPVYLQPNYVKLGFKYGYCKNTENYFRECISMPMYPSMTKKEQDKVIKTTYSYFS